MVLPGPFFFDAFNIYYFTLTLKTKNAFHDISEEMGNGLNNCLLHFFGNLDLDLDLGTVFKDSLRIL